MANDNIKNILTLQQDINPNNITIDPHTTYLITNIIIQNHHLKFNILHMTYYFNKMNETYNYIK